MRILHRDDVGRARAVVDQGQLAEMFTDAEHAEDHLASVLANEDDFDSSLPDDEQRVARIILEEDDTPAGIEFLASHVAKTLQFCAIEPAEERDRPKEIGGCRRHEERVKSWMRNN